MIAWPRKVRDIICNKVRWWKGSIDMDEVSVAR